MRRLHIVFAIAMLLSFVGFGCQSGKQRKEAYAHWNSARGGVQGSLAAERYKLGNLDDARKAADEAIKLDPTNASYRVLSARIHIERNQLEAADQELATARKLAPTNGEPDYLSGIVYQRWQKPQLALDYYAIACEKSPAELQYLMARVEMLVQLKRNEDAISLLEGKMTFFEYSGPLRDMLGGLYQQRGELPKATEMYLQATILSPDDPLIREHLAMSYFKASNYRDCMDQIDRLLKLEDYQKRADLYMLKGECHLQRNQLREARAALETSLEQNPSSVPALLTMSKVAIRTNDLDRAELSLRKAMSLEGNQPQVFLGMGYLRMKQQRWDDALAAFEKASKLDPKDAIAVCMSGLVLEKKGNPDEAMRYYGRALQINPNEELAKTLLSKAK